MRRLCGIETEYGLWIDGRGPESQQDDSKTFVEYCPNPSYLGWDNFVESPRADLRGFEAKRLSVDPRDQQYEYRTETRTYAQLRADRILTNGARFYNDHGHPEYCTPECFSAIDAALEDLHGESVLLDTLRASGMPAKIYKNNTDFHGASYGTHESYLVPRSLGFDRLFNAVVPVLIARQILCGAGKVGSETGQTCNFQLSQRADFLTEVASVDTLYRRPIFNTRDEPHADPNKWTRMHVICGDANRNPIATMRKLLLVQCQLKLLESDKAPKFPISNPVKAFEQISKDESHEFVFEGHRCSDVIRTVALASLEFLDMDERESSALRGVLLALDRYEAEGWSGLIGEADWAAKKYLIEHYFEPTGDQAQDLLAQQSLDLAYSNIDPEESLFTAMQEMNLIAPFEWERNQSIHTRAYARGLAVEKFNGQMISASWGRITFATSSGKQSIDLEPELGYPAHLSDAKSVEEFIESLRNMQR